MTNGHISNKRTWLYAFGVELPELEWGQGEQRLHPVALEHWSGTAMRRRDASGCPFAQGGDPVSPLIMPVVRTVSAVRPVNSITFAKYAFTLFSTGGAHLFSASSSVSPR